MVNKYLYFEKNRNEFKKKILDYCSLFNEIDQNKIDLEVAKYLDNESIVIKPYNEIYEFIKTIKGKNILLDPNKANYSIYSSLVEQNNITLDTNPTLLLKAIKNEVEIENIKEAHIKDGLAVFRFMKYLKEGYVEGVNLSEISLSDYIAKLRSESKGFIDLSFNTKTIIQFLDNYEYFDYFTLH